MHLRCRKTTLSETRCLNKTKYGNNNKTESALACAFRSALDGSNYWKLGLQTEVSQQHVPSTERTIQGMKRELTASERCLAEKRAYLIARYKIKHEEGYVVQRLVRGIGDREHA